MARKLRDRWLDALLVLLAAAALSLVFAPAITGYLLVNRLNSALERLSLLNNLQWTLVTRDEGWFQSQLLTELTVGDYAPITLNLELLHGPVLPGVQEQRRSPFLMGYLRGTAVAPDMLKFRGPLHFNGDWSARLDRQDLLLRPLLNNPGIRVALRALEADISYAARHGALGVRAAAGKGDVGDDGEFARLVDLAALGEYRVDVSGWLFGDTSLRAAQIVAPTLPGSVFGVELAASSTENGPFAAASAALRVASGEFFERRFGPIELDAIARNLSLTELRNWFHRRDSYTGRALQRLFTDATLRLLKLRVFDAEGQALMEASGRGATRAATPHDTIELSLDLDASKSFAEFVFWHSAKRTLGRSVLFGKLNELSESEQSEVARASAAKQLSVLAARGYLTWNRGWYGTRVVFDGEQWSLNDRLVAVR